MCIIVTKPVGRERRTGRTVCQVHEMTTLHCNASFKTSKRQYLSATSLYNHIDNLLIYMIIYSHISRYRFNIMVTELNNIVLLPTVPELPFDQRVMSCLYFVSHYDWTDVLICTKTVTLCFKSKPGQLFRTGHEQWVFYKFRSI